MSYAFGRQWGSGEDPAGIFISVIGRKDHRSVQAGMLYRSGIFKCAAQEHPLKKFDGKKFSTPLEFLTTVNKEKP